MKDMGSYYMGKNKRLYYFQVFEGFYKHRIIKKLAKLPSGDSVITCYQKMVIMTLNSEGWFYYERIEENIFEEIALEIDVSEEIVRYTVSALARCGLAVLNDLQDSIMIKAIPGIMKIGSEGESAARMRDMRRRNQCGIELKEIKKEDDASHCADEASHCAHNVQKCAQDKDKDIDEEIDILSIDNIDRIATDIINYFNQTFKSRYKCSQNNIEKVIKTLEMATPEQIYKMIDNEYQRYISGEAGNFKANIGWFFGIGFDECLDRLKIKKCKNKFNDFKQNDYDFEKLEKELMSN